MNDLFDTQDRQTIGIDPGDKTTGIAVYSHTHEKLVELKTVTFWDAVNFLNEVCNHRKDSRREDGTIKGVALMIENPNLNRPVFPMKDEKDNFKKAIESIDFDLHETTLKIFSRRAQNVGMNKQLAKFLIEYSRRLGFRVEEVRPSKKKVKAEQFNARARWEGRSSQHSRDAACLILPYV